MQNSETICLFSTLSTSTNKWESLSTMGACY